MKRFLLFRYLNKFLSSKSASTNIEFSIFFKMTLLYVGLQYKHLFLHSVFQRNKIPPPHSIQC